MEEIETVKQILDIKLYNNDKYIIDNIISFLNKVCYNCRRFYCKKNLEIVYIRNSCTYYQYICKFCISSLRLNYCLGCNCAHYDILMNEKKDFCYHCDR